MKTLIGNNIKQIRKLREMSQKDVSLKLGISQSTYSMIEKGKLEIDDERLYKIASILENEASIIKNIDVQTCIKAYIRGEYPFTRN